MLPERKHFLHEKPAAYFTGGIRNAASKAISESIMYLGLTVANRISKSMPMHKIALREKHLFYFAFKPIRLSK
jgi:hypothetical protein